MFDLKLENYLRKINTKRDMRLLSDGNFEVVVQNQLKDEDFARIEELYNLLYLDKYSYHNPQFTRAFFKYCSDRNIMTFYCLRDRAGVLQGVVAYYVRGGVLTTPFVGYNTALPQELGLYRRLIALSIRDTFEKNLIMNMSSGAPDFKRVRGGIPFIEYSAIYTRHLPWHRRAVIGALIFALTYIGVPLIRRFKL
jgi:hypothetical protein